MRPSLSTRRVGVRSATVVLLTLLLTVLIIPRADAAHGDRTQPKLEVNAFSHLGAKWWQWALEQPVSTSPLTDPTGDRCGNGQRGPIFFLAGPPPGSGPTVDRVCVVPTGKALFF